MRRPRSVPTRHPAIPPRQLLLVGLLLLLCALLPVPAAFGQAADPPPDGQPAPSAQETAEGQNCDALSNPLAADLCRRTAAEQAGGGAQQPTGGAGGLVSSAGDSALRGLTSAVADSAGWMLRELGSAINETTSPDVGARWFLDQYQVMLALAILIALPMLLLSVIQALIRGDIQQIIRSAFVYLPLAGVISFVAPAITQMLVAVSDWMSVAVSANATADAERFMEASSTQLSELGAGTASASIPVFSVLIGALLVLIGGFSVWIELLLRSAAIYVSVLFLPLGFAAMIWPGAWKWAKRLVEFLVAIIFAKVFIVAIISLAAAGLANSAWSTGFEGVLASAALLILAAFSPWALLRMIPLAEAGIMEARGHRSAMRRGAAAGGAVAGGSQMVAGLMQTRLRGNGNGIGGGDRPAGGGSTAAPAGAVSSARAASSGGGGGGSGGRTTPPPAPPSGNGGPGGTVAVPGARQSPAPNSRPASNGGAASTPVRAPERGGSSTMPSTVNRSRDA